MLHALNGDDELRGVEKPLTETVKRDEQRELQRVNDVINGLDSRLIETKHPGRERAKKRGGTQNGKHAEHAAQGDAERELLRREALF